jgi:hypothetical protein
MIRSILYAAFLLLMVPLVVADFKLIIYSTGSSSPTTGSSSPTTGTLVNVTSPPPAMTASPSSQFRTEGSLEFTNWTTGTSISNLTGAIVSAFRGFLRHTERQCAHHSFGRRRRQKTKREKKNLIPHPSSTGSLLHLLLLFVCFQPRLYSPPSQTLSRHERCAWNMATRTSAAKTSHLSFAKKKNCNLSQHKNQK